MDELIVLDLDIDQHVERDDFFQQRFRVAVVIDAIVRDIPCHTDDAPVLQRSQIVHGDVLGHHGDALVASRIAGDRIEHASVVEAVAGVRANQQRMPRPIGFHRLGKLRWRADLLSHRRVMGVDTVGEPRGVEDVHVAVDLRFFEDSRIHEPDA